MIAIKNDEGLLLDLFPEQNLVTEQTAAWLVDNELPAEYSYPIDVPLTENNKRFVRHGYRPVNAQPRMVLTVTVMLGGVLYRRAQMSYQLQNGKLNISLDIDSAEAYEKLRKLSLLEALSTPVRIGDGLVGSTDGVAKILSFTDRLDQIAAAPIGTCPAAFFPFRNEGFFEDDLPTKLPGSVLQPYVNAWMLTDGTGKPGGGRPGFVADYFANDTYVYGYPICPQLHLWWVLEQIMLLAGFRIESQWLAKESTQRLCILNLTALPANNESFDQLLGGHFFIPGQCLPDMDVSDFLKAIKQRFGLCFSFNSNTRICTIAEFKDSISNKPAIDFTPYQTGLYEASRPDDRGFAVSEFIDSGDELYKDAKGEVIQPRPLLVGKGKQTIDLKAGTCQSIQLESGLSQSGKWVVPTVRQPGNVLNPIYKASDRYVDQDGKRRNSIGLRLVSYQGMKQDSTGAYYPFASTQETDLAGRNGIWRNGLRNYYYFRDQTQRVTQKLLIPAHQVASLPMHRSCALTLEDQIRRSYLITKLQAEAPGPQGLLTAIVECQTIPSGVDQPVDVDEPLVWVELIQQTTRTSFTFELLEEKTQLILNVWVDASRTAPAQARDLRVLIRMKKTYNLQDLAPEFYAPPQKVQEYLQPYVITGTTQVLEKELVTRMNRNQLGGVLLEDWMMTANLNPGEGYNLL